MNRFGNSAGNIIGTTLLAVLILVCLAAFSPTLRVLGSLTIAPWSDATPYVSGMWNGIGGAISKTLPQITAPAAPAAPAPAAPAIPAVPAGSATHCPDGGLRGETFPDRENGVEGLRHRDAVTCKYGFSPAPGAAPAKPAPAAPAPAPVAPAAAPAIPAPQTASVSCNSKTEQHAAAAGQGWTPSGSWRVVNFWTNEAGKAQGERKLLLAPGQNPTLMGGGSSWSWPSACEGTVKGEYASNGLTPVDLGQLQAEGLAR